MEFLKDAGQWGFSFDNLKFDFAKIIKRSRKVADISARGVNYLMKQHKITVVKGRGKLTAPSTVAVLDDAGKQKETLTAPHVIIATGGRARMLPGIKTDGKRILTSSDALILKKIPKSMIIIGAGAIGMEFAYFYHTFGTKITIVEMLPSILPAEDEEISHSLRRIYEKAGMQILTGSRVESIQPGKQSVKIAVSTNGDKSEVNAEKCLVAIGVQGNIEDIGLEAAGVRTEDNAIVVDKFMRTNVPGLYAIGDVVGAPWLAHIASHEGIICADKIAGKETPGMDYSSFPGCTYCQPQVASIGLTEKQAREDGHDIKVGKFPFIASGKARAGGHKHGFIKIVFEGRYGKILGAHILGSDATEMIAEFALAKTLEATNEEIAHTIHAHPTLSEAVVEATLDAFEGAIHI